MSPKSGPALSWSIDANPKAVEDYSAGKKQALAVLIKDLRARAPQANPKVASELLRKMLA